MAGVTLWIMKSLAFVPLRPAVEFVDIFRRLKSNRPWLVLVITNSRILLVVVSPTYKWNSIASAPA